MKNLLFALIIGMTNNLNASIVFYDNNDAVYPWGNNTWSFDIDQDGNNDISLNTSAGASQHIKFIGLTNANGANRVNSLPGTAHTIDCAGDTLTPFTNVWDNESFVFKYTSQFTIGFGSHKVGFRLIKDMPVGGSGYIFGYIDYSYMSNGDVVIHGWYYEDSFNVSIIANTLLDYPYDANCIHYDTTYVTTYDTAYVTVYDTTFITVTDTLFIEISDLGNPMLVVTTIKVYPNPSNDQITINTGDYAQLTNYEIKIENSLGQVVFNNLVDQQTFIIDILTLGGVGMYYLTLYDDFGIALTTRKILLN